MNLCFICVHLWRPAFGNACYHDPEILPRLYSDLCRDRSNRTGRDIYGPRERRFAGAAEPPRVSGNLHCSLRSCGIIFLGEIIFNALGITDADFQVAGGIILLGLAGRELLNLRPSDDGTSDDFGVVPLGMPLIAGPALLTALLILVDTVGLVVTLVSLAVNLALVAVAFWNADWFTRLLGRQGLRAISKIVALLLAAIAVSLIRRGWQGA